MKQILPLLATEVSESISVWKKKIKFEYLISALKKLFMDDLQVNKYFNKLI